MRHLRSNGPEPAWTLNRADGPGGEIRPVDTAVALPFRALVRIVHRPIEGMSTGPAAPKSRLFAERRTRSSVGASSSFASSASTRRGTRPCRLPRRPRSGPLPARERLCPALGAHDPVLVQAAEARAAPRGLRCRRRADVAARPSAPSSAGPPRLNRESRAVWPDGPTDRGPRGPLRDADMQADNRKRLSGVFGLGEQRGEWRWRGPPKASRRWPAYPAVPAELARRICKRGLVHGPVPPAARARPGAAPAGRV
jgi:hypothetical protein